MQHLAVDILLPAAEENEEGTGRDGGGQEAHCEEVGDDARRGNSRVRPSIRAI